MRYGSVCSGIEAATVAWHPLGWEPAWFAEIERFPKAVLAHRWPGVPDLGDFTKIGSEHGPINLLVGGTPCQSFSVAGLRQGLADPRGNLMLEFGALARRVRARWLVWENVPGVLSSNGGRDFGAFLGMLGELGYGFAYRVLDAQFFGVAQRRRRVFVVGHAGGLWQRAAAVLFEPESLRGDPAPRREAGKGSTASVIKGAAIGRQPHNGPQFSEHLTDGSCFTLNCTEFHAVAHTLAASTRRSGGVGTDFDLGGGLTVAQPLRSNPYNNSDPSMEARMHVVVARSLNAHPSRSDAEMETLVAAYGFAHQQAGSNPANGGEEFPPPLRVSQTMAVACDLQQVTSPTHRSRPRDQSPTLSGNATATATATAVRRLTPRECERLQGFPDDYTAIPGAKDGPRYKALGNSMAVPVMRWIGERIQMVEDAARAALSPTKEDAP